MPAQIVLVHDVEDFATEAATGLRKLGYEVAVFTDPNAALDALEAAETVELLITRVNFPAGKPNGVSLALMTRARRPNIRVVFAAVAETEPYTEGIGEFLAMPVHIPDLVATVLRLLPKPPASAAWRESG
jgi:DNA-binding NtrC family response regulator